MPARTLLTLEDVPALPDRDECRYELDEGVLVETALPRPRHQIAVTRLLFQLEAFWYGVIRRGSFRRPTRLFCCGAIRIFRAGENAAAAACPVN
jgi:Uma2 family endonuclease